MFFLPPTSFSHAHPSSHTLASHSNVNVNISSPMELKRENDSMVYQAHYATKSSLNQNQNQSQNQNQNLGYDYNRQQHHGQNQRGREPVSGGGYW
jgi:hypothetical protein